MKIVSYVMRKKENKYVIKRHIFNDGILVSTFWVNTYNDYNDYLKVFQNIYDLSSYYHWKIIKDVKGSKMRELQYIYD